MKTIFKNIIFFSISFSLVGASQTALSSDLPQADANGNYSGRTSHLYWQVTDPDPNGLNCRGDGRSGAEMNTAFYYGENVDIGGLPVRGTFQNGETFKAYGFPSGWTVTRGRQDKTWVFVDRALDAGGPQNCFVRANRNFIRPIREPQTTSQAPALPMTIQLGEGVAQLIVPNRDTTQSAYGGDLRLYDVHIAKMYEVTRILCDRGWSPGVSWYYFAGGGNIDMGIFQISCREARAIASEFGLSYTETTTLVYSVGERQSRTQYQEIPVLDLVGSKIPKWLDFVQTVRPVQ
jgi:serine/threonine-protein kinase